MSLKPDQLKEHCNCILQSRRIRNKIVILCEGLRIPSFSDNRPSPQTYKEMERLPDANFYRACVPINWTQNTPEFFNCGDRKDVIDTYFNLLELHAANPANSYLSPDKLLALVDRDLYPLKLPEAYNFSDTETICNDFYRNGEVNSEAVRQHRIWVTGLIYKEAYFLIPELQPVFDSQIESPYYKGSPLVLETLYRDLAKWMEFDPNLKENFCRAVTRLLAYAGLDCTDCKSLSSSWEASFMAASDEARKNELIQTLLTVTPVKEFWEKLQPPSDNPTQEKRYREQLSLEIAKYYSYNSDNPRYHIPFLLKMLYESIYGAA